MQKLNILIIEDTKNESDSLIAVLTENNYTIVGVATTFSNALQLFYEHEIDLVIIDIFLNGQPDGITFAETISITPNSAKPFVFLTSSKDRQIFERAKLTKPYSFLMKPFNELEILYAIEFAIEKFYNQTNVFLSEEENTVISKEYLFIKKKNILKKVMLNDIIFIEVDERYCNIVTETQQYLINISLTKLIELIDQKKFIRTHRSFIVNSEKIEEIILNDNLLILKGNHKVNLSDNYKSFINQFQLLK